jgi:type VI secretion system protein ImpM
VTGLLMPSVDRVGRYFPLTFAVVARHRGFLRDAASDVWLDQCEDLGRAALQDDLPPEAVADMLSIPKLGFTDVVVATAEWWTDGSPRVQSYGMTLDSLPGSVVFGRMLGIAAKDSGSRADESE